jgi:hypothetical protein
MNIYEQSLADLKDLFENTTDEEFEKEYLELEGNIGLTINEYFESRVSKVHIKYTSTMKVMCSSNMSPSVMYKHKENINSVRLESASKFSFKYNSYSSLTSSNDDNYSATNMAA